MRGIDAVAVRLERRARRVERLLGPAELARRERDLGFGDDASRAGERFVRAERASRAAHERLCPDELAELRHRDAASASAGASSRSATRFSAPSGSPAASARAAAVISESIGIPPHLSLPPFEARD